MTYLPIETPTRIAYADRVKAGDQLAARVGNRWRVQDVTDVEVNGDTVVLRLGRSSSSILRYGDHVRVVAAGRYGVTNASTAGYATETDDRDAAERCAQAISGQVHDLSAGYLWGWVNGTWRTWADAINGGGARQAV
jgi:hypothetical protein